MAEEIDKEQLQQSGNNRTVHALYASGSIYEATKVGVATKIQILVRPKPDQPDQPERLLRPCKGWAFDYPVSAIKPVNAWCYIPTSLPQKQVAKIKFFQL